MNKDLLVAYIGFMLIGAILWGTLQYLEHTAPPDNGPICKRGGYIINCSELQGPEYPWFSPQIPPEYEVNLSAWWNATP